jgi:hypothetical protein
MVKKSVEGKDAYDSYHGDYGFGGKDAQGGPFPIKSITTIMKELNHTHVDYLKIDVEGFISQQSIGIVLRWDRFSSKFIRGMKRERGGQYGNQQQDTLTPPSQS